MNKTEIVTNKKFSIFYSVELRLNLTDKLLRIFVITMIFSIFLGLCLLLGSGYHQVQAIMSNSEFCYTRPECGPSTWEGICQTGNRQSPIALTVDSSTPIIFPEEPIRLNTSYTTLHPNFYIQDNGHTVQVHLANSENYHRDSPSFTEGPGFSYVLAQIHLHWGYGGDFSGSEHTLNNNAYPMEIHLVHYSTQFNNLSEALELGNEDAVTVFGIFVEKGPVTNPALASIVQGIQELQVMKAQIGEIIQIDRALNLYNLISADILMHVLRYSGSLTTPGCTEKVRWFVFRRPITISAEDLSSFLGLPDLHGDELVNNFRPLQPLAGRTVQLHQMR